MKVRSSNVTLGPSQDQPLKRAHLDSWSVFLEQTPLSELVLASPMFNCMRCMFMRTCVDDSCCSLVANRFCVARATRSTSHDWQQLILTVKG